MVKKVFCHHLSSTDGDHSEIGETKSGKTFRQHPNPETDTETDAFMDPHETSCSDWSPNFCVCAVPM